MKDLKRSVGLGIKAKGAAIANEPVEASIARDMQKGAVKSGKQLVRDGIGDMVRGVRTMAVGELQRPGIYVADQYGKAKTRIETKYDNTKQAVLSSKTLGWLRSSARVATGLPRARTVRWWASQAR